MNRPICGPLLLFTAACGTTEAAPAARPFAADSAAAVEWRSYGHDAGGMRYSPLAQIHRGNVTRLRRAWTFHTGDPALAGRGDYRSPFETTPLVVGPVLYLSTPSSRVIALDAESGEPRWTFDPYEGNAARRRFRTHRGVAYWSGPAPNGGPPLERILFGTGDGRLVALDARTGRPAAEFGARGEIDLRAGVADRWPRADYGVTSPPAIFRDLVIVGSAVPEGTSRGPAGDVRAFDVRTGALVWRFRTVPPPGAPGHETWADSSWQDRTGANAWSVMSVDAERGLLFVPLGSASYDFYGGDRRGANLYANSLVALDAATGALRWHRQLVHHDIWDYDLPAQPSLIAVRRGGREIPAVAQVTKMGFVFAFDRVTGEPLFEIEERPVPASNVPGEAAWPTQPVPVAPPPLVRQHALTRDDLTAVTPTSRAACAALFDRVRRSVGLYTPPDTVLTLWFPGTLGGATWSGASFDPATGYLFVNVNEVGAVGAIRARGDGADGAPAYQRSSPWGPYARFWDDDALPCQRPPWGRLHAVDLTTGTIAWSATLGVVDTLLALGVAKTGAPSLGGSIATAGGLVFIAGTNDRRLRAFDARTGAELWEARLEASGHATPITYQGRRSGRQYVVVAAGGGGFFSAHYSDAVVAFALPE